MQEKDNLIVKGENEVISSKTIKPKKDRTLTYATLSIICVVLSFISYVICLIMAFLSIFAWKDLFSIWYILSAVFSIISLVFSIIGFHSCVRQTKNNKRITTFIITIITSLLSLSYFISVIGKFILILL
ncbi:MAG: hypothetical protein IKA54_06335 [Clostridia bacterium]|nr:hypothetical protein [Clostridia bacterium]